MWYTRDDAVRQQSVYWHVDHRTYVDCGKLSSGDSSPEVEPRTAWICSST